MCNPQSASFILIHDPDLVITVIGNGHQTISRHSADYKKHVCFSQHFFRHWWFPVKICRFNVILQYGDPDHTICVALWEFTEVMVMWYPCVPWLYVNPGQNGSKITSVNVMCNFANENWFTSTIFHWSLFPECDWWEVTIGLYNGLATNNNLNQ